MCIIFVRTTILIQSEHLLETRITALNSEIEVIRMKRILEIVLQGGLSLKRILFFSLFFSVISWAQMDILGPGDLIELKAMNLDERNGKYRGD